MTSVFRAVAVLTLLFCAMSALPSCAEPVALGDTFVWDGALVQAVYEPYVFVSDIWSRWGNGAVVPVYVNSASAVPRWATVRVTGRNAAINSTPIIIADSLQIYVTETGNLSPPLPPGVDWSYFQNVDVECEGLTSLYSQASQYPQNKAAPFDDAQGARRTPDSGGRFGILSQGTAGTIPYAKSLENTSSSGTLSGKVLTAKLGTYYYIEEPDRSSGIRVNATPPSANIGAILTVSGAMSTVNGEKAIINPSVSTGGSTIINPLGMPNKSLGGGDWFYDSGTGEGQRGVTDGVGLNNIGLLVKICGKVTASDSANKFFYVDDGSGSVKVSWDWQTSGQSIIPPNAGWTVSVSGISSIAADSARLLRVRSQWDMVLHDPLDTGNPTVAITSPAGTTWHKASNASHITISGTAFDTISGVASVQVKIGSGGQYVNADYDAATYTWSYDWQTPPTGTTRIYAKATDFAGNPTEVYKDVTVSNVDVIYVSKDGDDTTGASWATAKTTIAGGLAASFGGKNVWVAQGTYVERITLNMGSYVGLYGGFAGAETVREQRNWARNTATIDGDKGGSVVTVISGATVVDGFIIRNGSAADGAGVYCTNSCTVANNIIRENVAGGCGGGIYASVAAPVALIGNVLLGNIANFGGGIYYASNTFGTIANNTIVNNVVFNTGGGAYLNLASPDLSNNIIAFNNGGGIAKLGGYSGFFRNDVYGNSDYDYQWTATPPSGNYSFDPRIPYIDQDDWHIQPNSPCVDAGYDSVIQTSWMDIDRDARQVDIPGVGTALVDIGADESDGCGWYTITFSRDPDYGEPGGSVNVTAHMADWNNDPVCGLQVMLSVANGSIIRINGQQVTGPGYSGVTNASGNVVVTITRAAGCALLTVQAPRSCGRGSSSGSVSVPFWHNPNVDIFLCLDCTGSMWGNGDDHGAQASVKAFLTDMSNNYGIQFRVGGIKFNNPYTGSGTDSIETDSYGNLTPRVITSLNAYSNLANLKDWIDNGYRPSGYDSAELQLDALHYAALNMSAYATAPHKYIVLVTDDGYHSNEGGSTVTLAQIVSELTNSGCPVYISLWNDASHASYVPLVVNGGQFDPSNSSGNDVPGNYRYPFANLRNRILSDL